MNFIVNSSQLLKQLSKLSGVLSSNPVVPILGSFLFEVEKNKLTITASDLQTSMVSQIKVESKQTGSIVIPARIIVETLKNLPDQPITFAVKESTYSIEINSNNGRYKLSGENATDFPKKLPVSDDFSTTISSHVLLKAINSTVFATSSDELRPEMGGVYLDFSKQGMILVSTDGHRMVRYWRTDTKPQKGHAIIIPRKALQLLRATLPDENVDVKIECNMSNALFEFGHLSLMCRLIDERFPDYKNAIPSENPIKITLSRVELLGLLKRIAIYANQTTRQVKLTVKGSELHASAEDLDFSNAATERLTCEHVGEDIEIGFNAKLLIEMLTNLDTDQVEFNMSTPNKASLILPTEKEDGEDILMLIVPIMLHQHT